MRKWICVPMITLCLLLVSCSGDRTTDFSDYQGLYQKMSGCRMEALVSCEQENLEWEARLRCNYVPDGESTVEVLAPETIAGVKAVFTDTDWRMEYEDICLNVGSVSREKISPALCLPRLIHALRDGWLLEENEEKWDDIPCCRMMFDQSGSQDGKIISTIWLKQEDGTPLRGEIAVDGEIILSAEFTDFVFCDTIDALEGMETESP